MVLHVSQIYYSVKFGTILPMHYMKIMNNHVYADLQQHPPAKHVYMCYTD